MGPSRLHRTENERVIVFEIKKFFQKIFPKKLRAQEQKMIYKFRI